MATKKKTAAKKPAVKSAPAKSSADKRITRALELLGTCVQFRTEEEASEFAALVSGKPVPKTEGDDEPAPAPAVVTSSTGP